jgi:hypothetical protein
VGKYNLNKKMKTTKLFMAALVAAAMFTSCGSEGPTGPTGATGLSGAANVTVVTATIPAGGAGWTQAGSTNVYYVQVNDPYILNYNTDVVMAYVQGTVTPFDYIALPLSNFLINNDELSFSYNNSLVTFYYVFVGGSTGSNLPSTALNVKIAVIPPGVMKQHPNLNVNDYHAVMAVLNQQNASK